KGKDTRDYLAAAFPELNAWERAGADASSAGMVDAGFENQKELTKVQLDNQKEIAEMHKESPARVACIMETNNLSKAQEVSEIMRQMLTHAYNAGRYFTRGQIKELN